LYRLIESYELIQSHGLVCLIKS